MLRGFEVPRIRALNAERDVRNLFRAMKRDQAAVVDRADRGIHLAFKSLDCSAESGFNLGNNTGCQPADGQLVQASLTNGQVAQVSGSLPRPLRGTILSESIPPAVSGPQPRAPVLTATLDANETDIDLSWLGVPGATEYDLVRDGTTTVYTGTATSFVDVGPGAGEHCYIVTAHNSLGSTASNEACATVPTVPLYFVDRVGQRYLETDGSYADALGAPATPDHTHYYEPQIELAPEARQLDSSGTPTGSNAFRALAVGDGPHTLAGTDLLASDVDPSQIDDADNWMLSIDASTGAETKGSRPPYSGVIGLVGADLDLTFATDRPQELAHSSGHLPTSGGVFTLHITSDTSIAIDPGAPYVGARDVLLTVWNLAGGGTTVTVTLTGSVSGSPTSLAVPASPAGRPLQPRVYQFHLTANPGDTNLTVDFADAIDLPSLPDVTRVVRGQGPSAAYVLGAERPVVALTTPTSEGASAHQTHSWASSYGLALRNYSGLGLVFFDGTSSGILQTPTDVSHSKPPQIVASPDGTWWIAQDFDDVAKFVQVAWDGAALTAVRSLSLDFAHAPSPPDSTAIDPFVIST